MTNALVERLDNHEHCIGPCCENATLMGEAGDYITRVNLAIKEVVRTYRAYTLSIKEHNSMDTIIILGQSHSRAVSELKEIME